jgi:hypothetical protein
MLMGCYGIGVTRIVAASIEQNHDERGIIWPDPLAPFHVVLVPLNLQKSARVREAADALYAELTAAGIEVLYDDRDARPGVKFADAELLASRTAWCWASAAWRPAPASTATGAPPTTRTSRLPRHAAFIRRLQGLALLACCGALAVRACCACWRCAAWPSARTAGRARRAADRSGTARGGAAGHQPGECFGDQYDSAVWYTLMEPKLRRYVKDREERWHPAHGLLRDASQPGASVLPPGLVHGGARCREPLRSLGGLERRGGRADAGDAVLARTARHAPLRAGDPHRGQHPHGLRDPAPLPGQTSTTTCGARSGATTAACGTARLPGPRRDALDALLERRRRPGPRSS